MTRFFVYSLWGIALMAVAITQPSQAQPRAGQIDGPPFHEAAQQYLEAQYQQALNTVNKGLRAAPGDARLLALREKIQQQRKRQQAGNGSGGAQSSSQGGQAPPSSSSQEGTPRGQGQPSSSEPNDATNPQQGEQDGATGEGQAEGTPEDESGTRESTSSGGASEGARRGQQPGSELSRAQAARILRALETQEKQLLRQVQKRPRQPHRILKEW